MSLDTQRHQPGAIKPSHTMVDQLLRLARRDSDPVSVFIDGSGWGDAQAAVLVLKDAKTIRPVYDLLSRHGYLTPGKPVDDRLAEPGATPALWAVLIEGMDDLFPAPSHAEAEAAAVLLNGAFGRMPGVGGLHLQAKAVPWPYGDTAHRAQRSQLRDMLAAELQVAW